MNDEEIKREKRRRRRIRNQIFAYLTLAVLIVAALAVLCLGANGVVRYVKNYNNKVSEAIAEAESSMAAEAEKESALVPESTQAAYEEKEYTAEPSADPLGELVTTLLQDMTLEEMVYGMFLVTPEALTGVQTVVQAGESTQNALLEKPVGGIVYSVKNLKSEEQFTEMLQNTKSFSKYPLFLVIDTGTSLDVMTTLTLRENLDLDGVVMTDALDDAAVTKENTPEEAAVAAIEAGADVLYKPSDLEAAYNGVLEAVEEGRLTKERIYESLYRIYRVKYKDTVLQEN